MTKLAAVSQIASIAVQNALAHRSIRQEQEALRELSARLLTLQDEERRRIARGLHDSTVQDLSVLSINITRARKLAAPISPRVREMLDECMAIAKKCMSDIRTLSFLLHPPLLDEKGLISALRLYLEGIANRSTIKVNLEVPKRIGRLPSDVEMTLFRITQESLNASK